MGQEEEGNMEWTGTGKGKRDKVRERKVQDMSRERDWEEGGGNE